LEEFPDASVYPDTEVQLCVIHQIRNSLKYVSWEDKRAFIEELLVHRAADKGLAEKQLN